MAGLLGSNMRTLAAIFGWFIAVLFIVPNNAKECHTVLRSVYIEMSPQMIHSLCRDNTNVSLVVTCEQSRWLEYVHGFCRSFDINIGKISMQQTLKSDTVTLELKNSDITLDTARVIILKYEEIPQYNISVWGHQNTRFVLTVENECLDLQNENTEFSTSGERSLKTTSQADNFQTNNSPLVTSIAQFPQTKSPSQRVRGGIKHNLNRESVSTLGIPHTSLTSLLSSHKDSATASPKRSKQTLSNAIGQLSDSSFERDKLDWMENKRIQFEKKMDYYQSLYPSIENISDYGDYSSESVEVTSDSKKTQPLEDKSRLELLLHPGTVGNTVINEDHSKKSESHVKKDSQTKLLYRVLSHQDNVTYNNGVTSLDNNLKNVISPLETNTGSPVAMKEYNNSQQILGNLTLIMSNGVNDPVNIPYVTSDTTFARSSSEVSSSSSTTENEMIILAISQTDSSASSSSVSTSTSHAFTSLSEPTSVISVITTPTKSHEPKSEETSFTSTIISTPTTFFQIELQSSSLITNSNSMTSSTTLTTNFQTSTTSGTQTESPTSLTTTAVQTMSPTSTSAANIQTTSSTSLTTTAVQTTSPTSTSAANIQTTSSTSLTTTAVQTTSPTSTSAANIQTTSSTSLTTTAVQTTSPTSTSAANIQTMSSTSTSTSSIPITSSDSMSTANIQTTSSTPMSTANIPTTSSASKISTSTQNTPSTAINTTNTQTTASNITHDGKLTSALSPSEDSSTMPATVDSTAEHSSNTTSSTISGTNGIPRITLDTTEAISDKDDTMWPIVIALVLGIPALVVIGIAVTVFHRRRRPNPQKAFSMKTLRSGASTPKLSASTASLRTTLRISTTSVEKIFTSVDQRRCQT